MSEGPREADNLTPGHGPFGVFATAFSRPGVELPRRRPRPGPPEDVMFPVTPMLDMAFQLLAFFVLTFQVPTGETHLDLDLPVTAAALPGAQRGQSRAGPVVKADSDLENDLRVRVEADDLGDLKSLRLGESPLPDVNALGDRLRRYVGLLENKPLRVRIVADDTLRYEVVAQVMAACSAAGVATIRLASPTSELTPTTAGPAP